MRITANNLEETRAVGLKLAERLKAGDIVLLYGDLGAGKTALVQAVAKGLGIEAEVTSPTYTLMHLYEHGRIPLCHCDFYRLEVPEQVQAMGFDDFAYSGTYITMVEWPERMGDAVPANCLEIRIEKSSEDARVFAFAPRGTYEPQWEADC